MTVKQTPTATGLVEITTDPLEAEETVFAITATQFWAATSRAKEGGSYTIVIVPLMLLIPVRSTIQKLPNDSCSFIVASPTQRRFSTNGPDMTEHQAVCAEDRRRRNTFREVDHRTLCCCCWVALVTRTIGKMDESFQTKWPTRSCEVSARVVQCIFLDEKPRCQARYI